MIAFEKPWILFFILFIFPASAFSLHRIKRLKEYYNNFSGVQRLLKVLCMRTASWTVSWVFLCIAAAVPLWGTKQIAMIKHGNAIIFAADISRSMMIADIHPSRLEFAKQYMTFLIDHLPQAACGLVTIKGQGSLAIPLSFNHQSIRTAVQTLSPFTATAAGSNLEHGLRTALTAFPENRLMGKTIILCTDGDETAGTISKVIPLIRHSNIQLIIIGFGTKEGGSVSILNEKYESILQHSALPDAILASYAKEASNGSFYISAVETGSVWKVLQAFEDGSAVSDKILYVQKPVRRVFECAIIALSFFCLGFCAGGIHAKKEK